MTAANKAEKSAEDIAFVYGASTYEVTLLQNAIMILVNSERRRIREETIDQAEKVIYELLQNARPEHEEVLWALQEAADVVDTLKDSK